MDVRRECEEGERGAVLGGAERVAVDVVGDEVEARRVARGEERVYPLCLRFLSSSSSSPRFTACGGLVEHARDLLDRPEEVLERERRVEPIRDDDMVSPARQVFRKRVEELTFRPAPVQQHVKALAELHPYPPEPRPPCTRVPPQHPPLFPFVHLGECRGVLLGC